LNRFHQQLWITAQPVISGRKEEFSKSFILNVHLHDKIVQKNKIINDEMSMISDAASESNNNNNNNNKQTINNEFHAEYFNRTRYMHCTNEVKDFIFELQKNKIIINFCSLLFYFICRYVTFLVLYIWIIFI
jgi:hypothetical protein